MFAKLFGGGKSKPPSREMLAQLLCGPDIRVAERFHTSWVMSSLEYLDQSSLLETLASEDDRANGGAELIKGCALQFMQGGPKRIGFAWKPLTDSQVSAAFKIYEAIVAGGKASYWQPLRPLLSLTP